jgi:hypothetical protein
MNNPAIWLLISFAYLCGLINAAPRNTAVDDADPPVRYLTANGDVDNKVCIGCGPSINDKTRLFNGTATYVLVDYLLQRKTSLDSLMKACARLRGV